MPALRPEDLAGWPVRTWCRVVADPCTVWLISGCLQYTDSFRWRCLSVHFPSSKEVWTEDSSSTSCQKCVSSTFHIPGSCLDTWGPALSETDKQYLPRGACALMWEERADCKQWPNLLEEMLWGHLYDVLSQNLGRGDHWEAPEAFLPCTGNIAVEFWKPRQPPQMHGAMTRLRTQGLILSTEVSSWPWQLTFVQDFPVGRELSQALLPAVLTLALQGSREDHPSPTAEKTKVSRPSDLHKVMKPTWLGWAWAWQTITVIMNTVLASCSALFKVLCMN